MKRAAAVGLILAMALSLSACASIFDSEHFSSSEYVPAQESAAHEGAVEVGSYLQITLAVSNLVSAHGESMLLRFSNYQGDIAADLAAACREVSTATALGAYAVDYISYDLDRIVAYYEAEVYVYYKRTAEELENMVGVDTDAGLYDAVAAALAAGETELTVSIGASEADEAFVLDCVDEAYFAAPLACVERPDAVARVYVGTGFQRIVEIYLDYGLSPTAIDSRRTALETRLGRLAAQVTAEGAAYRALQALTSLAAACVCGEGYPGSLWSALAAGEADSLGMALAYKALCDTVGVECQVVEGRLERAEHYWNIITVDGASYHVDASRAMELGYAGAFLMSDSQMWGSYWWDDRDYPSCAGPLSYSALINAGQQESAPPSPEAGAAESAPAQTPPAE